MPSEQLSLSGGIDRQSQKKLANGSLPFLNI